MEIEGSSDRQSIALLSNDLLRWLHGEALSLWEAHGVDRESGGFFEALSVDRRTRSLVASGAVRRGRVVARQIFTFDAGYRAGWRATYSDPVRHGADYLFSRMYRGDGRFNAAVDALGAGADAGFSLYETAFYLFALARLKTTLDEEYPTVATALACLADLRRGWGKSNGGFEESRPATLPLKSNPHMHLLEAALEWIAAADPPQRDVWIELARELVELCCSSFMDRESGAIREYFDAEWHPVAGEAGSIIEPGHQFEWAWLLLKWASLPYSDPTHRDRYRAAALRLVELAERFGVDEIRGVAINELWDDMTPKDAAAKLWPQTERLKAWCAVFDAAAAPAEAARAAAKIHAAAAGLTAYFFESPAGMWHEVQRPDGTFVAEPCKASSFYHIVCAIETLRQTSSSSDSNVLY
jgi:mannose/cellobiose epimerase-like protein (N-acyl-D-glucosamine 2-epimerase family)